MGWDGNGNFDRDNGTYTGSTVWQKDKAAGTKITASNHDTHDQDLADGIEACLAKNGENAMTGDLDMGGNSITDADNIVANTVNSKSPHPTFSTFTPVFVFTSGGVSSYAEQTGNVISFGDLRIVTISLNANIGGSGASGQVKITGIPDAPAHNVPVNVGHATALSSDFGDYTVGALLTSGSTTISFYQQGSNANNYPSAGGVIRVDCQLIYKKA